MPNLSDIAAHYSRMQIQTASAEKAVCMLHERCLFLILSVRSRLGERDRLLDKAQNILAQLQVSLIVSDTTSRSLWYLYDYCYVLLERRNPSDLEDAATIMSTLVSCFQDLLRS